MEEVAETGLSRGPASSRCKAGQWVVKEEDLRPGLRRQAVQDPGHVADLAQDRSERASPAHRRGIYL